MVWQRRLDPVAQESCPKKSCASSKKSSTPAQPPTGFPTNCGTRSVPRLSSWNVLRCRIIPIMWQRFFINVASAFNAPRSRWRKPIVRPKNAGTTRIFHGWPAARKKTGADLLRRRKQSEHSRHGASNVGTGWPAPSLSHAGEKTRRQGIWRHLKPTSVSLSCANGLLQSSHLHGVSQLLPRSSRRPCDHDRGWGVISQRSVGERFPVETSQIVRTRISSGLQSRTEPAGRRLENVSQEPYAQPVLYGHQRSFDCHQERTPITTTIHRTRWCVPRMPKLFHSVNA